MRQQFGRNRVSMIVHRDQDGFIFASCFYSDRRLRRAIFERVLGQVLDHLLNAIGAVISEPISGLTKLNSPRGLPGSEVVDQLFGQAANVDLAAPNWDATDSARLSEIQQISNQLICSAGRSANPPGRSLRAVIDAARPFERGRSHPNHLERVAQIVANDPDQLLLEVAPLTLRLVELRVLDR